MLETDITALAADLQAVWSSPTTDAKLKKRIVRTVIQEVVADIDEEASEIVLAIHWIGGAHTELRLTEAAARATKQYLQRHNCSHAATGIDC